MLSKRGYCFLLLIIGIGGLALSIFFIATHASEQDQYLDKSNTGTGNNGSVVFTMEGSHYYKAMVVISGECTNCYEVEIKGTAYFSVDGVLQSEKPLSGYEEWEAPSYNPDETPNADISADQTFKITPDTDTELNVTVVIDYAVDGWGVPVDQEWKIYVWKDLPAYVENRLYIAFGMLCVFIFAALMPVLALVRDWRHSKKHADISDLKESIEEGATADVMINEYKLELKKYYPNVIEAANALRKTSKWALPLSWIALLAGLPFAAPLIRWWFEYDMGYVAEGEIPAYVIPELYIVIAIYAVAFPLMYWANHKHSKQTKSFWMTIREDFDKFCDFMDEEDIHYLAEARNFKFPGPGITLNPSENPLYEELESFFMKAKRVLQFSVSKRFQNYIGAQLSLLISFSISYLFAQYLTLYGAIALLVVGLVGALVLIIRALGYKFLRKLSFVGLGRIRLDDERLGLVERTKWEKFKKWWDDTKKFREGEIDPEDYQQMYVRKFGDKENKRGEFEEAEEEDVEKERYTEKREMVDDTKKEDVDMDEEVPDFERDVQKIEEELNEDEEIFEEESKKPEDYSDEFDFENLDDVDEDGFEF